jgi:hypothetical protein
MSFDKVPFEAGGPEELEHKAKNRSPIYVNQIIASINKP